MIPLSRDGYCEDGRPPANRRRFLNEHIESTLSTGEFWRYVVSYILVLLIPVALGSFVYARSVRVVSDDAIRLNSSLLAQTQATIDGRVSEIQNVVRSLAADPSIGRVALADQPVAGPVPYYMIEVWDQVVSFTATNSFVESVQVHFRRSGAVVSPRFSAVELDRFYGDLFRYGGLTQEQFVRRFLHAPGGGSFYPAGTIHTPDGDSRVIVYSQSSTTARGCSSWVSRRSMTRLPIAGRRTARRDRRGDRPRLSQRDPAGASCERDRWSVEWIRRGQQHGVRLH